MAATPAAPEADHQTQAAMSEPVAKKPSLRTVQRDLTRRMIREAARQVFSSQPFEQVALEEIARAAGVGRTTIYLHYSSKNALLLDLLEEEVREQTTLFEQLAQTRVLDRSALRQWVREFGRNIRRSKPLFRMYSFTMSLSEDIGTLIEDRREENIRTLSRRFPGLVARADASPEQFRAAAASRALLAHIETYGNFIAGDPTIEEADAATEVLVDDFLRFLRQPQP
jgi:AcrR family transcriptional regulator